MSLDAKALRAGYGRDCVLDGVDFRIEPGTITALLGPNGCGKSTLLKVLGRLLAPRSGEVLIDGKEINSYDTSKLARKLAILSQFHHTPAELTVEELAGYGRYPYRRPLAGLTARDREVVESVLEVTGLAGLRKRPVRNLSGGERQRVWMALALAQEPEILLLDEPTTFLDLAGQFEVAELICKLKAERGLTVLMVLHDVNLAARFADMLLLMKGGRICYAGVPQEVVTPGVLAEIYEVQARVMTLEDGTPHCVPQSTLKK
jgi:iron complex transport system ATP-binding protein